MSATPRSARLSSPGEVVAILVASAVFWVGVLTVVAILFITVFIPAVTLGGRGEIPHDFPVYPDAHLESATASTYGDCTTVEAAWMASSPASSVTSFYERELATGAWSVLDTTRHVSSIELYFESTSSPHREGLVTISAEPYQTSSTLISLEMYKSRGAATANCRVLPSST